jgi:hypothetical protein
MWGGSHRHTFADLLKLAFHVLDYELRRIQKLEYEFFDDLDHMIRYISRQLIRLHYQITTNKLLDQRESYLESIHSNPSPIVRCTDQPLQYLTECDYDVNSVFNHREKFLIPFGLKSLI